MILIESESSDILIHSQIFHGDIYTFKALGELLRYLTALEHVNFLFFILCIRLVYIGWN